MPSEIRLDRPDDRSRSGREGRSGDLGAGQGGELLAGLRTDRYVGGAKTGGRRRRDEAGPAAGARNDRVGAFAIGNHRLAYDAQIPAAVGRLIGPVKGRDFGVGRRDRCDLARADRGDPQHALLGNCIARLILRIETLEVGIGRRQAGAKRFRWHQGDLALARFEQHRGVRCRDPHRHPRIAGHRRQHQPLQKPAGQRLAQFAVGHPILLKEGGIGLLAELAVEPARVGNARDLGIDQPLRDGQAGRIGERLNGVFLNQSGDQRIEFAGEAGIIGLRVLLPRLGQPALERLADFAIGQFLAAHLCQCPALLTETARRDAADVSHCERCHDCQPDQRQDDRAALGLGQVAEGRKHAWDLAGLGE